MLRFVRQVPCLIKIKKARSATRAFSFQLKVSFLGSSIDPLTGFSISLPEVDKLLSQAVQVLESLSLTVNESDQATQVLSEVQKALVETLPSDLAIHSFEVLGTEDFLTWQAPWNPAEKWQKQIARLVTAVDEYRVELSCSTEVSAGLLQNFRAELEECEFLDDNPEFWLQGAFKLAGNWGFALKKVQLISFRQQWVLVEES